jgi:hypothetical protein
MKLEQLNLPQEEIAQIKKTFRANGITSLDYFLERCLQSLIEQTAGKELIAWPPLFVMQERSEQFLAERWASH